MGRKWDEATRSDGECGGQRQLGCGTDTHMSSEREVCKGTVSRIKEGITALVKELM